MPDTGDVPLVADMSSHILSRPLDVSRFGVIYAGAQKNIGPAGLTIVIVRDDLIGQALPGTPAMLDYKIHADNESMYNTPPTYALYVAGLVFQWLKKMGGLDGDGKVNIAKAEPDLRLSRRQRVLSAVPWRRKIARCMNIPFRCNDGAWTKSS